MKRHCNVIERASVDEAYLDITQNVDDILMSKPISRSELTLNLKNTYVVGHSDNGSNDEGENILIN